MHTCQVLRASVSISIVQRNSISNIKINDNGKRRSARRVSISPCTNDNDNNNEAVTPVAKKLKFSLRKRFKCCAEIKSLPDNLHCSGCLAFKDYGTKAREEHTTKKHECFKAWTKDVSKVPNRMRVHTQATQDYIENKLHYAMSAFQDDVINCDEDATASPPKESTTAAAAVSPPEDDKDRNVTFETNCIKSGGQQFEFEIPSTHTIIHKNYKSRLMKKAKVLDGMRLKVQQKQHQTDSIFSQGLWSIAFAACPALALSAAQHLIPLFFWAFLHDTGLFDFDTFDDELCAKSFPSDNTLRKCSLLTAARDTMLLGNELKDKKLFMACDKGNKKGIGHLVKCVATWIPGMVTKRLLDVDASGGTSRDCALGIQSSMNKLKQQDDAATHLLFGMSTDSGGGGTLEKLHEEMQPIALCCPADEHLVANCCIHSIQVQLSNAVKAAFGEGALDKVNAMQLLHSVCRLQESVDLDEWRHILYTASVFVSSYDPMIVDTVVPGNAKEEHQLEFYKTYNVVLAFHSQFKTDVVDTATKKLKGTLLAKMTAPILTRWWTVGAGAAFVFDYCLVIFHACQTVINLYKSTSTPNGIASDLFAMMRDVENFIDVTLIRCFNKAYINKHLDWMQSCTDLTRMVGFQAHNVAIRFFLMDKDIRGVMYGTSMEDYHEAIEKAVANDKNKETEHKRHLDKLKMFINEAHDSLMKHFSRWMTHKLIPAALLSERPMAQIVAAAMLDHNVLPTTFHADDNVVDTRRMNGRMDYYSVAHKETINLVSFDNFIRNQMAINVVGEHTPQARTAAERICVDLVNLRDIKYDDEQAKLRWHMQSSCLPLASFLQFVESGVKEAKNVSSTDRSEIIRSALAIIRSASPLGRVKVDDDLSFNVNKILALLRSAFDRAKPHTDWIKNQDGNEHYQRFNQVHYSLTRGHFRDERIEAKKTKVDTEGIIYKKENKQQRLKEQTITAAVKGLVPFGKLVQKRNMDDLETELLFRGVDEEEIPAKVTERKTLLRELETKRLTDEGVPQQDAEALAKKHFKKLSTAPFKLTDD